MNDLRKGLTVRSSKLCLQYYPLWVVTGDLGRRGTSGCGDGDNWQKAIDAAAEHISWTVVVSTELCATTTEIAGSPIKAPVRMALICRPGSQASVLTGAAATALASAAQKPSVGSPCTPNGWKVTTVAELVFHHVSLPTVNDASGCHLAAPVQALIEPTASAQSALTTPTYVPFTDHTGPPSDVAAVVTASTQGGGTVFPPLTFAWAKTGNTLFITTYGSRSCPSVVEAQIRLVTTGPQRLTLRASDPENPGGGLQTCTKDLSPTTSMVTVPSDIDPAKPVVVTLNEHSYTLPGR